MPLNLRQSTALAALGLAALCGVSADARATTVDVARQIPLFAGDARAGGSLVAPVAGRCRTLPDRELARLVRRWPPSQRPTAFAVILGESGGRPCAVGDVRLQTSTWGPSVCLFQLRSIKGVTDGGVRDRAANLRSVDTCVRNAHALWAGEGWRPWSAYTNGSYRRHLPRARAALG